MSQHDKPAASKRVRAYLDKITHDVEQMYKLADKARKKGKDPTDYVECPPAHDMAGRVENLVGPEGVGNRIRELKREGLDQDHITFKICDEIIEDKFKKMDDDEKVDRAIRVALAIKTEGVVSAPLEGISKILIRKDEHGGPPYLSLFFAGPIRAAGGTVQAFAVLISDYVARKMKIAPWVATEEEVGRLVEEVKLYDRIVNLQYPSTKDELDFAVRHLRVELNGDPTEQREVSAHRNMKRIETNFVRSGPCLVLNDGVLLKSKKILKVIKNMGIEGWEWLHEIKKLSHSDDDNKKKKKQAEQQKEGEYGSGLYDGKGDQPEEKMEESTQEKSTPAELHRAKLDEKMAPVFKYIADVIGGRPVFSYPSRVGGHRIRYGHSRNTGLAACGMNPNAMYIMNEFLAVGTQIRIERPGKSASVMPVTSIEGPTCLLENGDVIQFNEPNSYKLTLEENPVKEILFIGDILFGFGEFAENNHKIPPSGYVEEWWSVELEKLMLDKGYDWKKPETIDIQFKSFKKEQIADWISNPFDNRPNGTQTLELSRIFNVPLHAYYLFHYGNANGYDLLAFRNEIKDYYLKQNLKLNETKKLRIPSTDVCKNFLYNVYTPHKNKGEYLELDEDLTIIFIEIYALEKNFSAEESKKIETLAEKTIALEVFKELTDIVIRDKAPYYMGTRMGRPEKAKERKMKPPVHALIPLGHDTDNNRVLQQALSKGVEIDIVLRECPKCKKQMHENYCYECHEHTEIIKYCPNCKNIAPISESTCPSCGKPLQSSKTQKVIENENFNRFMAKLPTHKVANVKGVKGLSSEFKMPEPIEKGILRALNEVWIFKDGTVRFDALDIPFNFFTPREIGTPVEKLRELGYIEDYLGNPLENIDQICELMVQDIIITEHCGDYFVKVAHFVDDELQYFYDMDRYYNCNDRNDLVGEYFAGLAPHTSAAIICRIIGFTPITAGYGHPYWHAAKRRNCDGDEDGVLLLLDLLLNFSKFYLPAKLGGKMDAPLVLSVTLDPNEVDGEAYNVDTLPRYELEFFEKTQEYLDPGSYEKKMGLVKGRLKTPAQYEGMKFTHPTKNINYGPKLSSYKTMGTMKEKIDSQLGLAKKIRAVDAADVARKILKSHFTPDILGNLRAFSAQGVRCPSCQAKYRRVPLSRKCNKCGGSLLLTVSKGGISKYLEKSLELSKEFDLGHYTTQRMELIEEYVKSLTDNPKVKQVKLTSFFK